MQAACPLSGANPTLGRIYEHTLLRGPLSACFIVRDANGLALTYCYYQEEPGRRAAANLMTKEEARR
jgi:hypothetical protein